LQNARNSILAGAQIQIQIFWLEEFEVIAG